MIILGLGGNKRCGKDTVANYLVKSFGFKKIALADFLKTVCSEVFNIPIEHFQDQSLKELTLKPSITIKKEHILIILNKLDISVSEETFDKMLSLCYRKKIKTTRELMQFVGTDLVRNNTNPDIWSIKIIEEIKKYPKVVVPDCRFSNERSRLKELGATIIRIHRKDHVITDGHISEHDFGEDEEYDVIVYNDSTESSLLASVGLWLTLSLSNIKNTYRKRVLKL